MKGFRSIAGVLFLSTVLTVSSANAVPYTERGDAGQSLSTAQTVFGFNSIGGSLQPDPLAPDPFDLVDLYRIFITLPTFFEADTGSGSNPNQIADPVLFLLDFNGRGIYMNDDRDVAAPGLGAAQSHLGHLAPTFLPGFYYLGISFSGVYPLDLNGLFVFDPFSLNQPHTTFASSLGASSGILGSYDASLFDNPNSAISRLYSISLAGVIPEPAPWLLLIAALVVVGRQRVGHKASPLC